MTRLLIDTHLVGKPQLRARLEAMVNDPGVTIDSLRTTAAASGIRVSRSAAARWMLCTRKRIANRSGALLGAVIGRVIALDTPALKALAKQLRVKVKNRN